MYSLLWHMGLFANLPVKMTGVAEYPPAVLTPSFSREKPHSDQKIASVRRIHFCVTSHCISPLSIFSYFFSNWSCRSFFCFLFHFSRQPSPQRHLQPSKLFPCQIKQTFIPDFWPYLTGFYLRPQELKKKILSRCAPPYAKLPLFRHG